ncbi:MAG: hypothetical protein KC656_15875, partial [Myxococcales bacterium]|nr:hypothetical protein [Myxococcales bacterium]
KADGVLGEQALAYTLTGGLGGGHVSGDRDGEAFGAVVGAYDGPRFVADLPALGAFLFGVNARVQGARGVFVGAEATCPIGSSPETALAPWFHGDLTGLDPVDVLEGPWSVSSPDCGVLTATWTFVRNDEPLYWDVPELGAVATVGGPSTYDLTVPGGAAQLTVTGDAFTGLFVSPFTGVCQLEGVRQ